MVNKLFEELASLPQIEAIALGGSRAGEDFDEKSDYDVYLYTTAPISEDVRRGILSKYCSYMEISNSFWELEDDCTLKNGIDIDILYRNLDDFTADVSSVVNDCNARTGYTTCMWHNLVTCKIIFDRNGRLKKVQEEFAVPYPEKLRHNIIEKNMKLLSGNLPSYDSQIKKAIDRGDMVSINHRVSAFMESYFDIIFALNRLTHPGEKRLVELSLKNCDVLPVDFEENIQALFECMFNNSENVHNILNIIVREIKKIVD